MMRRLNKQKTTRPSSNDRPKNHQRVAAGAGAAVAQHVVPVDVQQAILDVFARAFPMTSLHDLRSIMQEVKGHLFNRDFAAAFGRPDYLQIYALRWSAARALAYANIFARSTHLDEIWSHQQFSVTAPAAADTSAVPSDNIIPPRTANFPPLKVACIGGGAGAEVVALAAVSQLKRHSTITSIRPLEVLAIDIADWTEPIQSLYTSITTPPPQSIHASEAAIKAAVPSPFINPNEFSVKFIHRDILAPTATPTTNPLEQQHDRQDNTSNTSTLPHLLSGIHLVTIMFTLNELFTASISATTTILLDLTDTLSPTSILFVVDSPGSYSEVKLGGSSKPTDTNTSTESKPKKYPMKWLLDHTLLDVAGRGKWEKLQNEESVWFRIGDKGGGGGGGGTKSRAGGKGEGSAALVYPIDLENMRYQIHVYRRL